MRKWTLHNQCWAYIVSMFLKVIIFICFDHGPYEHTELQNLSCKRTLESNPPRPSLEMFSLQYSSEWKFIRFFQIQNRQKKKSTVFPILKFSIDRLINYSYILHISKVTVIKRRYFALNITCSKIWPTCDPTSKAN